jgi:hypothetical protein
MSFRPGSKASERKKGFKKAIDADEARRKREGAFERRWVAVVVTSILLKKEDLAALLKALLTTRWNRRRRGGLTMSETLFRLCRQHDSNP